MQVQTAFHITPNNDVTKIQTFDGIGQQVAANALRVAGKFGKAVLKGFYINGTYKKVVLESQWKNKSFKKQ